MSRQPDASSQTLGGSCGTLRDGLAHVAAEAACDSEEERMLKELDATCLNSYLLL